MMGYYRVAGECGQNPREGTDGTAQVIERTTRGESLWTDHTQAVYADLLRLVDCRVSLVIDACKHGTLPTRLR